MKKRIIAALMCGTLLFTGSTVVFADEKDDKIAELEAQVAEMQVTIDELTAELSKYTTGSNQDEYNVGDTWTVPGQWSLTVTSVEEVAERNEYAEMEPAAVYVITYTYENIGYEDSNGIMNGLFIDLSSGIMDSTGKMGYSYPGDITMYAQETPVGGTCEAQACVGVDNAGDFKINFSMYDANGMEQKAVFSLTV